MFCCFSVFFGVLLNCMQRLLFLQTINKQNIDYTFFLSLSMHFDKWSSFWAYKIQNHWHIITCTDSKAIVWIFNKIIDIMNAYMIFWAPIYFFYSDSYFIASFFYVVFPFNYATQTKNSIYCIDEFCCSLNDLHSANLNLQIFRQTYPFNWFKAAGKRCINSISLTKHKKANEWAIYGIRRRINWIISFNKMN